jgi:hypothetical protein
LKDTKEYVESRQLQKEGYLQEVRVEPGGNAGVQSAPSMSDVEGNGGNEYADGLLERIPDRHNMNRAYKRVKANKGSHGVDGMTVDELLQHLKQNGSQLIESIRNGEYVLYPSGG